MITYILSKLLNAANSDVTRRLWFYSIKDRVLKRFGRCVAWDQQHIVKKCWSCTNGVFSGHDNGYHWVPAPEQPCYRCQGTGIYDEFWVLLEVWRLGSHEFHRPVERIRKGEYFTMSKGWTSIIEGRIKHIHHPRADQAFWVLASIFTPGQVLKWAWRRLYIKINYWKMKLKNKLCLKRDQDIPF